MGFKCRFQGFLAHKESNLIITPSDFETYDASLCFEKPELIMEELLVPILHIRK